MRFARLYTRWRLRLGSPVRPTTAKMPHIVLLDVTFLCRTRRFWSLGALPKRGGSTFVCERERRTNTGRGRGAGVSRLRVEERHPRERARSDGLGGSETCRRQWHPETRRRGVLRSCGSESDAATRGAIVSGLPSAGRNQSSRQRGRAGPRGDSEPVRGGEETREDTHPLKVSKHVRVRCGGA
jgi:hypothetical protein